MRANYKKLAEEYRKRWTAAEERMSCLLLELQRKDASIEEKKKENDEWVSRYVQVLKALIELQDRVERKEG